MRDNKLTDGCSRNPNFLSTLSNPHNNPQEYWGSQFQQLMPNGKWYIYHISYHFESPHYDARCTGNTSEQSAQPFPQPTNYQGSPPSIQWDIGHRSHDIHHNLVSQPKPNYLYTTDNFNDVGKCIGRFKIRYTLEVFLGSLLKFSIPHESKWRGLSSPPFKRHSTEYSHNYRYTGVSCSSYPTSNSTGTIYAHYDFVRPSECPQQSTYLPTDIKSQITILRNLYPTFVTFHPFTSDL